MDDFSSLVARLQQRDPEAMAELYDCFGSLVYTTTLRVVRHEGAAEDLTQEAFLRIWNSIQSFDPDRGTLSSWVAAVARNRALDHLRTGQGRLEISACELSRMEYGRMEFRRAQSDLAAADVFQTSLLRSAVRVLGANQRLVLELAYRDGMSQTEIAARLKKPVGTIKTWARTALRTLRAHLQAEPASA
jgi:RNA polymerase sigma-70 factor (ECF subfamily)